MISVSVVNRSRPSYCVPYISLVSTYVARGDSDLSDVLMCVAGTAESDKMCDVFVFEVGVRGQNLIAKRWPRVPLLR